MDTLVDSSGLDVHGAGQWLEAKYGTKSRRTWLKLHLAADADSGMIVAHTLTDQEGDDPAEVGPLLNQIKAPLARVIADGAYDSAPTYKTIVVHDKSIDIVIPPCSTAVTSGQEGPLAQRDRYL